MGLFTRHGMRERVIWVRSYAERLPDGQWVAFCVTFTLGAQGDSAAEVRQKLDAMIEDYLLDIQGQDAPYAAQLLARRAPLSFWLKYFWVVVRLKLRAFSGPRAPFVETFTYPVPQAC